MIKNTELHLWNVDPYVNKELGGYIVEIHGFLKGNMTSTTNDILKTYNSVVRGEIELGGDLDFYNPRDHIVKHAHENNYENNYNVDYRRKTCFNRFSAFNLDEIELSEFKQNVLAKHGKLHSALSYEFSIAVEIYLRLKKGTIHILKRSIESVRRVFNDKISSPLHEEISELKKEFITLQKTIVDYIKGPKPTTLPRKVVKKVKKLDKCNSVLDEVKKVNEYGFTRRDYKSSLVNVFGQGDDRTVNSDLEMLLASETIVEDRMMGYNGTMKYRFKDNELYDEYQGPNAMRSFIEKFKDEFKDSLQTTKKELESFIYRVTGLFDVKSVERRLDVLFTAGYLTFFGESHKVFDISIN